MRTLITIAIAILALSGCEKDLELNDNNLPQKNLKNFLATFDQNKTIEDLFAFAGKSSVMEEQTPNFPVHIYARIPSNARDIRVYSSDSIQYPDSLELYTQINLGSDEVMNGFLTRFIDRDTLSDRVIRICYQHADSLHLSIPIEMRVTTLSSKQIPGILREMNSQGFISFDWTAFPATEFHFLTMTDPFGDVLFGLLTRRSDFPFYDLRFAERILFQSENKPTLQPTYTYQFSVFSVSRKGWLNASASNTFTAE